jgi:hypothetical protein
MKQPVKSLFFVLTVSITAFLFLSMKKEYFYTTPPINPPRHDGFVTPTYAVPIYATSIPSGTVLPSGMQIGPGGYFLITSTPSGPVTADTVLTSIPISPTERIPLTPPAKAQIYDSATGTISAIPETTSTTPTVPETPTVPTPPVTPVTPVTQVASGLPEVASGLPGMSISTPATSVQRINTPKEPKERIEYVYNMTILHPEETNAPSYLLPVLVTLGVIGGGFIGYGIIRNRL